MSFLMTDQYGSNNYEAAVCDMMVDSQEEIVNAIIKLMSTCKTEEEKVFTIHQPNNDNNIIKSDVTRHKSFALSLLFSCHAVISRVCTRKLNRESG